MTYQFKSPQFQETPAQLVVIGNVDVVNRNASATVLNGGGHIFINLSVFNGPVLVWPKPGEQWYVKLLKGQWVLAERSYISTQSYLLQSKPGDQVWNVQNNLTTVVNGILNFTDANGSLTTSPTPVWTSVTYENNWVDLGGGFPKVQYIADRNAVRIRGVMSQGAGAVTADGTPVFHIPAQYSVPIGQQAWTLASQSGVPGAGLKIVANAGGEFWIYGVGSCTAMFVDSISYFYKF